jgi:hypothetical protein
MGAAGTAAVLDSLDAHHGHRTIELERYATANKIWARKIKRLRLADLLCLDCGVRIEVRAKSKLAIRMSHSDTLGREWDAGLRDEDLVAFVAWRKSSGIASTHQQFFRIAEMRNTFKYAKLGQRKAASEGAERDVTWPATVPKKDGLVLDVDPARGTARYRPHEGRVQTYRLPEGIPAHPYAATGQTLRGEEQFIFGCVAAPESLQCAGRTWHFANDLSSRSSTDRYVAVKAAGIDGEGNVVESRLGEIAEDPAEDPRIRLEASGSLARMNAERHTARLVEAARQHAGGSREEMALSMEAIFLLSELHSPEATAALASLAADRALESEIRCAAVWGLGAAGVDEAGQVLPFLADSDDDVALHAIAGIGPIDDDGLRAIQVMLVKGTDREAASAVTLLIDEGETGIRVLLDVAQRNDRAGLWARAALGSLPEADVREVGARLGPKLEAVLSPMWVGQKSWLQGQQPHTPLDLLRQQCVRHLGRGTGTS